MDAIINYDIGKNLKDAIESYHKFTSNIKSGESCQYDENELIEVIKRRLGNFIKITKTYILEYPYIEKEWRELYGIHYSKTTYCGTTFSFRIHLISKDINNINEVDNNSYLGYVTLRPLLLPPQHIISKIILKPNKDFYEIKKGEQLYMITGRYDIHLGNNHLQIEASPFFSQDGVVTRCAHADIYMIAELMHIKYKINAPTIEKIISKTPSSMYGRKIPSIKGLSIQEMVTSSLDNGYAVKVIVFNEDNIKNALKYIDTYIESGIPCIIAFSNHVVVVYGHTIKDGVVNSYIIFDDSGSHIKETFEKGETYSAKIEKDVLEKKLTEEVIEKGEPVFLFSIEFDKVYYPVEKINDLVLRNLCLFNWDKILGEDRKKFVDYLINTLGMDWVKDAEKEIKKDPHGKFINIKKNENFIDLQLYKKEEKAILKTSDGKTYEYILKKDGDSFKIYKNLKYRILLVDSRIIKEKLYEYNVDINSVFLPHYVWYLEFYVGKRGVKENLVSSLIVDASSHQTKGYVIKDNLKPKEVISLLTHIKTNLKSKTELCQL